MDECFHEKDYLVSRRIYSNRVFDQVHERRDQEIQSLRERLSKTCRSVNVELTCSVFTCIVILIEFSTGALINGLFRR